MSKISATEVDEISQSPSTDRHQNKFEEGEDGEEKKPFFPAKMFRNDAGVVITRNFGERVWLVFEDPSTSLMGKWMSIIMMLLIVISCVGFVMASVPKYTEIPSDCDPELEAPCSLDTETDAGDLYFGATCSEDNGCTCTKSCTPVPLKIFDDVEAICIYLFTVDYLIRMFTVNQVDPPLWNGKPQWTSKLLRTYKYAVGALNLVDLIAIIPFWVELLLDTGSPLGFVRVLRLARVFRIFKLGKYNEGMSLFARTLHASIPALSLLCFFVMIGVVLFGSIIFFVEGGTFKQSDLCPEGCYHRMNMYTGQDEISPFISIPYSFYWVMVTMTTVGYGDQYPHSGLGKFITIICMLCGILTLALPITVLGSNFSNEYDAMHGKTDQEEEEEKKFWEHFASMVADSMTDPARSGKLPVTASTSRARLRNLLLAHAQGPATMAQGYHIPTLGSKGKSKSEGVGSSEGEAVESNTPTEGVITQLSHMMLQMQTTIEALKARPGEDRNTGDMQVQELDSRRNTQILNEHEDKQMEVKISRGGASGSMNVFSCNELKVRKSHKKEEVMSGSGSLPSFDIYESFSCETRKKDSLRKKLPETMVIENLDKEEDYKQKVLEKEFEAMQRALKLKKEELDRVKLGKSSSASSASSAASGNIEIEHDSARDYTTGDVNRTLDLQNNSTFGRKKSLTRERLKKVGNSFKFSQRLVKQQRNLQSLGETSRKVQIEVIKAKGFARDNSIDSLSFTVVCGPRQFETVGERFDEEILYNNQVFTYDIPLSTHSGQLLINNLEVIAHCGTNIFGAVNVPLTGITGGEVEYRLADSNNLYLKVRNHHGGDKFGNFAGNGRVLLKIAFLKDKVDKEHKFGTSFGKLLVEGENWDKKCCDGAFRDLPEYPEICGIEVPVRSEGKLTEHISDVGEKYVFDNDDVVRVGELNFNTVSDEVSLKSLSENSTESVSEDSHSPTVSPGREDVEVVKMVSKKKPIQRDSNFLGRFLSPTGKNFTGIPKQHEIEAAVNRSELLDDFLHNTKEGGGQYKY